MMTAIRIKSIQDEWLIYFIRKGKHRSESSLSLFPTTLKVGLAGKTIRFSAIFCDGCNYDDSVIGDSINKLYGVSYGFDHHYRSVRIGWRSNRKLEVIELFTYAYINGKRYIKYLVSVKTFEQVDFTIFHNGSLCIIELRTQDGIRVIESVRVERGIIDWILFPYFGGKSAAPNDIKILIKK